MKTNRILLLTLAIIVLIISGKDGLAQKSKNYMDPGIYLIVGAFEKESGARNFTQELKESGKNSAKYAYYPPKRLYYVHLGKYNDWKKSAADLDALRTESNFDQAWVFKAEAYERPEEPEPIKETVVTTALVASTEVTEDNVSESVENPVEQEVQIEEEPEEIEEPEEEIAGVLDLTEGAEGQDYFIYLDVYRKADNLEVNGKVEIIDPDKLKRIKMAETHANEFIPKSFSRTGNVQMICEIFGYKKIQHDFNIDTPFGEMTEPFLSLVDSRLVVDFELERYTRGDLATMYNVYFYKDAAIMRPESQYELNQLLEMLQENPQFEIMIHGHTNGNNSGPIITLEDPTKGFFSKSAPSKEGKGSAKKLSQERADIIRQYLVLNGISENRMKAKGWGGKKGIYKKLDPLAYKNVRVEIEILVD